MIIPILIVGGIGVACGLLLVVASKFMAVEVDQTAEEIRAVLPGANCGACGFAGCDDYAQSLASNPNTKPNLCIPGGSSTAQQLAEILGVKAEDTVAVKAAMRCAGTFDTSEYIMEYQGPASCQACNSFYQGRRSCSYGCLGYGDCASVCKFGALHIENGLAVVNWELCTGCGACVKACPKFLLELIPETSLVHVDCASHDKGAYTRQICKAGCIGCMKCQKTCQYGAITVTDYLAAIDPAKCTNCGACVEVCPTQVIHMVGRSVAVGG